MKSGQRIVFGLVLVAAVFHLAVTKRVGKVWTLAFGQGETPPATDHYQQSGGPGSLGNGGSNNV